MFFHKPKVYFCFLNSFFETLWVVFVTAQRQFDQRHFSPFEIQTIQYETVQPVLRNARFDRKKLELEIFLGLRSPVSALCVRRRFAAITRSKFRIESYPLLASSQRIERSLRRSLLLAELSQWVNLTIGQAIWFQFCRI